ncbi:hypothetical protein [Streptosporangium roseum]|uniref:hypothetical protein n=1 Tax=Streptosporangium roseum TaxID=2001 RepID=UPI0004CCF00E|nr:hypothetical protein [Streptosporangium roseum]
MSESHYLLGGELVEVVIRPNEARKDRPAQRFPLPRIKPYAPINVAIRYQDGTVHVRPRRGLRRADA